VVLEADRLPEPPENLPAPLDLTEEELSAWRLHWEVNPLHMRSHPTGRFRFDTDQKDRRLSRILSREKLLLIPLDEPTTQKRLGLDGRIGMSRQYPTTQRWALSLFRWFPEAHGLRYLSRHTGEHRNYCVFVDRCAGKLSSEEYGTISSLRDLVLLAADTYYLEVHWDG
jgi:hypothetical protein